VSEYIEPPDTSAVFIVTALAIFALTALVVFMRLKYQKPVTAYLCLVVPIMSFMDFALDGLFVARCFGTEPYHSAYVSVQSVALLFLVLAPAINCFLVTVTAYGLFSDEPIRKVMDSDTADKSIFAAVALVSVFNGESMNILKSGVSDAGVFNLKLPESINDRLKYVGLVSIFFEDFPQLVIQSYILNMTGGSLYSLSGASVMTSTASIAFGAAKRGLSYGVARAKKNSATQDSRTPSARPSSSEISKEMTSLP
jgi:hypothetical protein